MNTSRTRRPAFRYAALLTIPFALLILAACSSSGEQGASEKPAAEEQTFEDWQVQYASCMRGEGVDMPDNGVMSSSADGDTGLMEAVAQTCIKQVGDPPVAPGDERSDEEKYEERLKAAKCLRDNGFDVKDPKPNEGMGITGDIPQEIMAKCSGGTVDFGVSKN